MARRGASENGAGGEGAGRRAGRFSYEGLDRVMHEKARLGILASLAASAGGLLFNDLKELCSLTDGNLSRHLAVLADAGLVEVRRGTKLGGGRGGRQQTAYQLTASGRRRFTEYINVLEGVVSDAHVRERSAAGGGAAEAGLSPA